MARQRSGDNERPCWRDHQLLIVVCALSVVGMKLWVVTRHAGDGRELRRAHLTERRQQQLREATDAIEGKLAGVVNSLARLAASVDDGTVEDRGLLEAVVEEHTDVVSAGLLDGEWTPRRMVGAARPDAGDRAHHTHLYEVAAGRAAASDESLATAGGLVASDDRLLRAFVRPVAAETPGRFVGVIVDMREVVAPLDNLDGRTGIAWLVRGPEGRTAPLSTLHLPADWRENRADRPPEWLERIERQTSGSIPIDRSTARRLGLSDAVRRLHVERVEVTPTIGWTVGMLRPRLPTTNVWSSHRRGPAGGGADQNASQSAIRSNSPGCLSGRGRTMMVGVSRASSSLRR